MTSNALKDRAYSAPLPEQDVRPQRLTSYLPRVHPAWGEVGLPAFNLSRDLADLLGSDLIDEAERKFLSFLAKVSFTGPAGKPSAAARADEWRGVTAYVAPVHVRRVLALTDRMTNPYAARTWLREQATEASADWRTN